MSRKFSVSYHYLMAEADIPKLSSEWRRRVKSSIEEKLTTRPEIFGQPLCHSLAGYRKLRVGDYRIIFRIEKRNVKILFIGHRSDVYRLSEKRK
ncbi:MAG: type II toxin-antitoxin system RelE/ParE family toxin [bacterium]|nr:type II toxin-antitoxin system RelE/ParE family toxin [bacterium]